MDNNKQAERIYWVTLRGAIINVALMIFKFAAGFMGHSTAMVADAIHTLSDLITDTIILFFSKYKTRAADARHDYGRGKIETLTTIIMGFVILAIGFSICYHGVVMVIRVIRGEILEQPGYIALMAALVSIVIKEWSYRFTIKTGNKTGNHSITSNAWHHRSDATSSVVAAIGIGCAIFMGEKWRILDPITSILVSLFIMRVASHLIVDASHILLEQSLPDDQEELIGQICLQEEGVGEVRQINTRLIGRDIAIEVYVAMPAGDTVLQAHRRSQHIEERLRAHFGADTYVNVHVEAREE